MSKLETLGAFKAASLLRLLNKAIIQNWKGRDLQLRTFDVVAANTAHPYKNVRCQIARTLAEVLTFDVKYQDGRKAEGDRWSLGHGFPGTQDFIQTILPKLTLNFHNPGLQGIVAVNGASNGGAGGSSICVDKKTGQPPKLAGSKREFEAMDLDEDTPAPAASPIKAGATPSPTLIANAISAKKLQVLF